ncbi:MAG TPA: response regulator transcription factor [Balneolales bacterium]|nr:response regulator transcription factor [Balneolales bacterium]
METTFLIVDDHPLIRRGLKLLVESEPDYSVIGQAQNADEAQDLLTAVQPDITLLDISLPGVSGLELIKALLLKYPDLKIMVVSRHEETIFAERAIRAGARAYVMKQNAGEVIHEAIKRVLQGGIYLSETLNRNMLLRMSGHIKSEIESVDLLSDRELEVFDLTGRGYSNKDIAKQLLISIKTVESYRVKIRNKLRLKKIKDLNTLAAEWVDRETVG